MPFRKHFCPLLLDFDNLPTMQLSFTQLKLMWLLLPALAMAAGPIAGGLTTIGTGQLNLLTPQNLSATSINRVTYCKHEDDPYQFTSSLNYTFPSTPSLPESSLESAGLTRNQEIWPFDCFLEIPGGIVVFEVR